jgi:hypothetical protein
MTLETGLKTETTADDLRLIKLTLMKFIQWNGYYGQLCKYQIILSSKEYTTLEDDLVLFYKELTIELGEYNIKELTSLNRSIKLLRNRIKPIETQLNNQFINFLDNTILNFDRWIKEITEQKQTN